MFSVNHICTRIEQAKQSINNSHVAASVLLELQPGPTAGIETLLLKAGRVKQLESLDEALELLTCKDYRDLCRLCGRDPDTEGEANAEADGILAASSAPPSATAAAADSWPRVPITDERVQAILLKEGQLLKHTVEMFVPRQCSGLSMHMWQILAQDARSALQLCGPFKRLLGTLLSDTMLGTYSRAAHTIVWPTLHNDKLSSSLQQLLADAHGALVQSVAAWDDRAKYAVMRCPPKVHVPCYEALVDLLTTLASHNEKTLGSKDGRPGMLMLAEELSGPTTAPAWLCKAGTPLTAFPPDGMTVWLMQPMRLGCLDYHTSPPLPWAPSGQPGSAGLKGFEILEKSNSQRALVLPAAATEAELMRQLGVIASVAEVVHLQWGLQKRVYCMPVKTGPKGGGKQQQQLRLHLVPECMNDQEVLRILAAHTLLSV